MTSHRSILVADHHKRIFVCQTIDRTTGETAFHKLPSTYKDLRPFFDALPRPALVFIEACRSWEWVSDLCQDLGIDFRLINPAKMPEISRSKRKTDRRDVEAMVARLLHTGTLPASYRASREERNLRILTRRLTTLRESRRRTMLRIHALIDAQGMPAKKADFLMPEWREHMQSCLPVDAALVLASYLAELDAARQVTACIEGRVKEIVGERKDFNRLLKIEGVGPIIGATILAESAGIQRFPTARKFASFTGLVPTVRSSAGKAKMGRITRHGPPDLRWALGQAAMVSRCAKADSAMKLMQRRKIRKGKPSKLATCAAANKLARIVYVILARNEDYRLPKGSVSAV